MTASNLAATVAVVCDASDARIDEVRAYSQAHDAANATWFARRDMDDVEQGLREGCIRRVVFARQSDFLDALWSQVLTAEVWLDEGVTIEMVAPAEVLSRAQLTGLLGSWQTWQARRYRARVTSGLILSVVSVAAAFLLLWVAR